MSTAAPSTSTWSSPERRMYMAWVVALIATFGSLYFSEIARFIPCTLCWYQRICMYPLAVVLGIAAYRGDADVRRYVLPMAGIGWLIAGYHILEEWGVVPTLATCAVGVPCTVKWINWLGFITIPVLSFTAFTLIIALLSWRRTK